MKCERCQRGTTGYELHDYCAECSKNLCSKCMEAGCCGHRPAISGMEAENADRDPADLGLPSREDLLD